jgi:hypothetical protein
MSPSNSLGTDPITSTVDNIVQGGHEMNQAITEPVQVIDENKDFE